MAKTSDEVQKLDIVDHNNRILNKLNFECDDYDEYGLEFHGSGGREESGGSEGSSYGSVSPNWRSGNESITSKSPPLIKRGRGLQVDHEHLKLQTSDDFFDKRKSRKDCRVSKIFRKQIISHIDYLSKSTRLLNLEEVGVESPEESVARIAEKMLKARPQPVQSIVAKHPDKSKYKVFNTTKIFEGKSPCRKVNSLLRHCVIDKYCDAKSPKDEQRGLGVNRGHRYQKSQNLPLGGKDFF